MRGPGQAVAGLGADVEGEVAVLALDMNVAKGEVGLADRSTSSQCLVVVTRRILLAACGR